MIFNVSMPAVIASGLPDSVPAWYIGPAGATISMISRRPTISANGQPAANDFAQGGDIRLDPVQSLRPAGMYAETGHHLVKN